MRHVVAETVSTYDRIAGTYAAVNNGDVPGSLLGLARTLAGHVGEGAHIIDVGCGSGRDARWFESRYIRVTGIDLSAQMLIQARRVTGSSLAQMDMRQIALRDESFDGAWCAASLLHLRKRAAPGALAEMRRILRPGGMLMVSVKTGQGEDWAGGYVEGAMRFFAYYRPAELEAMLAKAGFRVCESSQWSSRSHGGWVSLLCVGT